MTTSTRTYTVNDYIPLEDWGRDHYSTLAYVETVMVDCGCFQVGADARMRSNRRNFRLMAQLCGRPKRNLSHPAMALSMTPDGGTRLRDGQVVANHDDWACLQDAAAEGLFTVGADDIEPGVQLHFSPKGQAIVAALRQHKAAGGSFANFAAPAERVAG